MGATETAQAAEAEGKALMAKRKGVNRQIARYEAQVKYAPQERALAGLMEQAVKDYGADVRTTKTEARSTIQGVQRAFKPTRQSYAQSRQTIDQAATDVNNVLASLGPAADVFKAATAREQGAQRTRIAQARTAAVGELRERKQIARQERQYGLREARGTYRDTMQKLGQQLVALGDDRGAYEAGRLAQLSAEAADRRWERQKIAIQNRQDEKLAKLKHGQELEKITHQQKEEAKYDSDGGGGGGKGGKGSGWDRATNSEIATAQSVIDRASRLGQRQYDKGARFIDALNAIERGRPAVEEKGSTAGGQYTLLRKGKPAIKGIENTLLLRAALEQVYNGHVSYATQRKLKQRGIRPSMLGLDPGRSERPKGPGGPL